MKIGKQIFQALPINVKTFFGRKWFEKLSKIDFGSDLNFMNYGYASLDPNSKEIELDAIEEKNRFSAQLYHCAAERISWADLDALEIGCGRGGGGAYIKKYFNPKSYIGIDLTSSAIAFCQKTHATNGLSYEFGDAENLRFDDNSMDIIINMESSGNYPNIDVFFAEVTRVLKPKGHFLYVDFRDREKMDTWQKQIDKTGLEILRKDDVSANVLEAIDLRDERMKKLIQKHSPKFLVKITEEFAGVNGSHYIYDALKTGEKIYMCYVLRKPCVI